MPPRARAVDVDVAAPQPRAKKLELGYRRARAEGMLILPDCGLSRLPEHAFDILTTIQPGEVSLECHASQEITKIDVSHNAIDELSPEMPWDAFVSLATFRAHDNRITSIAGTLERCERLQVLDLSKNCLAGPLVADGLASLGALRELDVSHNRLTDLGPSLPASLEALRAGHNALEALPPNLGVCARLRALSAEHNALTHLELALPSLAHVELSHNRLGASGARPSLGGCPALEYLDLRDNGLRALPSLPPLCSSHLSRLYLSFNAIAEMEDGAEPDGLPPLGGSLVELHLTDNRVRGLPAPLCARLSALKVLALTNNEIADLPSELGYVRALGTLSVDGNPLKQLRRSLWSSCEALKRALRTRGPPPGTGPLYLPADDDGFGPAAAGAARGGAGGAALLEASELAHVAREAASGARVLELSGRSLGWLPLEALRALEALPPPHGVSTLGGGGGGSGGWPGGGGGGEPEAGESALEHVRALRFGANPTLHGSLLGTEQASAAAPLLLRMRSLAEVELSGCALSSVSGLAPLCALPTLRALGLGANRLSAEAIDSLLLPGSEGAQPAAARAQSGALPPACATSLELLELSANGLLELPRCVTQLPRLHTLTLAHNRLEHLDAWRGATPALAHLDLSNNRLRSLGALPAALRASGGAIRSLSVANNELGEIPPALGHLTSLHGLAIGGNPQKGVRASMLEKGTVAVLAYLRDREHLAPAEPRAPAQHGGAGRPADAGAMSGGAIGGPAPGACSSAPAATGSSAKEQQLREALREAEARLNGSAQHGLSEAKRFALKKEAAKLKAELLREERRQREARTACG